MSKYIKYLVLFLSMGFLIFLTGLEPINYKHFNGPELVKLGFNILAVYIILHVVVLIIRDFLITKYRLRLINK